MEFHPIIDMVIIFFVILDPVGNVPFFASILRHFNPQEQRKIILREMFISLGFMLLFLYFGKAFFKLFHITDEDLQVAGGIILFLIGIKMLFSKETKNEKNAIKKDPLIVPLSIPAVAGPAILAMISIYGGRSESKFSVLIALFIAWLLTLPILLLSSFLKKILGNKGLIAMERLMGYVVVLIAVQMAISGLVSEFKSYP